MEENRNYENATGDLITIVPEPERTDDVSSAEGFVFLLATAASFGDRHPAFPGGADVLSAGISGAAVGNQM